MRSLMLAGCLALVACSTPVGGLPSSDEAAAKDSRKKESKGEPREATGDDDDTSLEDEADGAPVVDVDGKVSFYQQTPIAIFHLGAAEVSGTFESTPVCVSGDITVSNGFVKNEGHDIFATTTSPDSFTIKAMRGSGAEMKLHEVARFQKALLDTPTRVAGIAEEQHGGNAFVLENGVKTSEDPSCGTRFAAGVASARFFAVGFRIEFTRPEDKAAYVAQFKDVTAVANADPALTDFFAQHPAKVSTHVLVSSGQVATIRPHVDGASCSTKDLAGCERTFHDFADLATAWPTLEGVDQSVDDLTAPGASLGIYDMLVGNYTDL